MKHRVKNIFCPPDKSKGETSSCCSVRPTKPAQCAILFGCLALGELIVWLTGIKLPSSIIGMLLLTLFLKLGWIKLHWVQGMSDFLVANLGFFFVPPGVALMLYFDVIAAEFWPIVTASVVSTLLVIVVTGWVHQLTRKLK